MAMEIEVEDSVVTSQESLATQPGEGVIAAGVDAAAMMINGDGEPKESQLAAPIINQEESIAVESEQVEQPTSLVEEAESAAESMSPQQMIEYYAARELAEQAFEIELAEAKESHSALALERCEMEVQLKDLKADEKAALKNIQNIIKRGPNYPKKIETQQQKIQDAVENDKRTKSAIVVDDPSADQTWKLIPTSQVIDGIKGMGKKKAEGIIDLAPTLGDLEELRAAASKAHKPFKDVLPKGVGSGMADEIEEKILTIIGKHCAAVEAAKAESDSQPSEVAEEVAEQATTEPEVGIESESDSEPESLPEPAYFDVDDL